MKRFVLSLFATACLGHHPEEDDSGLRVLDGYNYETIVIALRRDGSPCHISDGQLEGEEDG